MPVHCDLESLCHFDLLALELLRLLVILTNGWPVVLLLLRIGLGTAIGFYPFLDLGVLVVNDAEALCYLEILSGDLILDELDLLGQIGDAVCPLVEYEGGVEGFICRHVALDEVDGEVVSRHDVNRGRVCSQRCLSYMCRCSVLMTWRRRWGVEAETRQKGTTRGGGGRGQTER